MKKPIQIVVIAPGEPSEFFDLLWEGVASAVVELSELGVSVDCIRTPCNDFEFERRILVKLLETPPNAIALLPLHASALDDVISRHAAQRVAVITFNADAPDSQRWSYVGPDPRKAGALAAEVLAKVMRGQGGILSFPGHIEMSHLAIRHSGFQTELKKWAPHIHEVASYPGGHNLGRALQQLLREHPQIGGIFVGNSRGWEIARAIEELGVRIPCVGFDNTQAVRPFLQRHTVSAIIDENIYQQGYVAVQRAYEAALSSREAVSPWTLIPSTVVFSANSTETTNTDSLNEAFELLVRQRTAKLRSYQGMLQKANVELMRLAETDGLTGLLNRRKFEKVLAENVRSRSALDSLSLLMIDLNGFKRCNDTFGHHAGDEVLKAVAGVLQASIREGDFCSRFGGDEFCVLMPHTDRAAALEVSERIVSSISETVVAPQRLNVRIQVSVGQATLPADGATAEDLFLAADKAMYEEKRSMHKQIRDLVTAMSF